MLNESDRRTQLGKQRAGILLRDPPLDFRRHLSATGIALDA